MDNQNGVAAMPNFNWSIVRSGGYAVTIYTPAIMLNAALIERLGRPDCLAVGYDSANMALAFREYGGERGVTPVALTMRVDGWRRVSCTAFVHALAEDTGIDFSSAKRYVPTYDAGENAFIVNIADFTEADGRGGRGGRRDCSRV